MNKGNKARHAFRNLVRAFGQFRSGLLWYAILKLFLFVILWVLYSQVLGQISVGNTPVYDFGILRVIDLRTVTVAIAAGALIILSFIFERSFLIFYFSRSYEGHQFQRVSEMSSFVGSSFRQFQLFCLELVSYAGLFILFTFLALGAFSIFGNGVVFWFAILALALGTIFMWARVFLIFVFAFFGLFSAEEKKPTVFGYLANGLPSGSTRKSLWIWVRFFVLTFILGLVLALFGGLLQWIIGMIASGDLEIFLLIGTFFLTAAGGFVVSGVLAVMFFGDIAELFFGRPLPNVSSVHTGQRAQKFKFGSLVAISVIALVGLSVAGFSASKTILERISQPYSIFAHRGFSSAHVQNSLEAFRAAVGAADFIELDVQITRDGQLIVFHDANFEDLTGEVGIPVQRSYSEISTYVTTETKTIASQEKELTAGIPLLRDVFQETGGNIQFAIEVKNTAPERMPELVSKLINLMQEFSLTERSYIISLDYAVLEEVKRLAPDIQTGIILTLSTAPPEAFDVDIYFLNALTNSYEKVDAIHKLGRKAYFWSFGSFTDGFQSEFFIGADGFIANDPLETRRLLDEYRNISMADKLKEIFLAIFG